MADGMLQLQVRAQHSFRTGQFSGGKRNGSQRTETNRSHLHIGCLGITVIVW